MATFIGLKCILGPALTLALFAPSWAQNTVSTKKPMELNFGIGAKTTFPSPSQVLNHITNHNLSLGALAEGRLRVPGGGIRLRAELDDWGRNPYSKDRLYSTAVRRFRYTAGPMFYFGPHGYACLELGINTWDIDSDHPQIGKAKYSRIAFGVAFGFQAEHVFLELAGGLHSMDAKGFKREVWVENPPLPGHLEAKEYPSLGATVSLIAGWKF